MISAQMVREVNTINPASVNGAASPIAVDTLGYHYAELVLKCGSVGAAFTVLRVEESNDGSTGWDAISGTAASGTTGANRLPQNGDNNITAKWFIPLQGRRRYLRIAATTGAATVIAGLARLSQADVSPLNTTQRGIDLQWTLGE